MKLQKANIKFEVNSEKIEFAIYHNLPKVSGLSITDALQSWLFRTTNFTATSFCEYINSKGVSTAITEAEFKDKK